MHRDAPLHTLPTLLLPIIKHQHYVLASQGGHPIFFLSWAWMDQEAEGRYMTQPAVNIREKDWHCGDRLWFCDWIAPFGHTAAMQRLIGRDIFPHHCARALYHRGQTRGQRVITFKGAQVSHHAAKAWQRRHPLTVERAETP